MGPRAVRSVSAVALAATGVLVVAPGAGAAPAAVSPPTSPSYAGDLPDPDVVVAGGTYWAYATGSAGRNLQVVSSPDLRTWTAPTDPLPVLPAWASAGLTWAPGVLAVGGRYVMYYTVHDPALGAQCLSVATSATPQGPFSDTSAGPLVCQTADGGSIDPSPVVDPSSGRAYLVWKSDDTALGRPTHLWGQRLAADGLGLAAGTSPTLLLSEDGTWQAPSMEGPCVVHRPGGGWVLLYGAGAWSSSSSGIGYATAPHLLGPYTDRSQAAPWLASTGTVVGPQGPATFTDLIGTTRLAFAAWQGGVGYPSGGVRAMFVGTLGLPRTGAPTLS